MLSRRFFKTLFQDVGENFYSTPPRNQIVFSRRLGDFQDVNFCVLKITKASWNSVLKILQASWKHKNLASWKGVLKKKVSVLKTQKFGVLKRRLEKKVSVLKTQKITVLKTSKSVLKTFFFFKTPDQDALSRRIKWRLENISGVLKERLEKTSWTWPKASWKDVLKVT